MISPVPLSLWCSRARSRSRLHGRNLGVEAAVEASRRELDYMNSGALDARGDCDGGGGAGGGDGRGVSLLAGLRLAA